MLIASESACRTHTPLCPYTTLLVHQLCFQRSLIALLAAGARPVSDANQAFNSKVPEAGRSNRCLPAYRLPPPPQWAPSHAGSASLGAALDGYASTATEQAADIGGSGGGGVSGPRVRCDAISAVRGYAIVSQGPLLLVYNTTGDTRLLFTRQHVSEERKFDRAGVDAAGNEWDIKGSFPVASPKWFVMPSSGGDVLVAEAARFGAVRELYWSQGCQCPIGRLQYPLWAEG